MGKKGERVTTYFEGTFIEDGHALHGKFYGGDGSGTLLFVYDAGAKKTRGVWVTSGGTVNHSVVYKKDGKWHWSITGSNPDGTKTEDLSILTIEDNGRKHTWRGSGTIDGKKRDDNTDVWRRLNK